MENIQERVTNLAGGIESPAYLFRLIYESLSFKRGAFFLADDYDQGFSPHATFNWLKNPMTKVIIPIAECWRLLGTTLPEMTLTIPDSAGKGADQTPDKPGSDSIENPLIKLALQDRKNLLPYKILFSGSTMLKESVAGLEPVDTSGVLIIKPFFVETTLVAFLVISGIAQVHIELLDTVFAPLLIKIIKGRLETMRVTHGHMPVTLPEHMRPELLKQEQERGRTIKISYDLLLTTVMAENNLLYPLMVKQDILLILGNFLNTLGRVYKDAQENVLYLKLYHKDELDEVLLIHQSYYALHTFFKVTKSMLLIQTNNFIPSQQSALIVSIIFFHD